MNQSTSLTATDSRNSQKSAPQRTLFVGDDGLRTGWGLVLFIGLMALSIKGISIVGKLSHIYPANGVPPAEIPPAVLLFSEPFTFLAVFFVTWIMSRIERRPISAYVLGPNRAFRNFLARLGWGFVCLSLLVLALWNSGLLVIDNRLLSGLTAFKYGAIWLFGSFCRSARRISDPRLRSLHSYPRARLAVPVAF